jgi:type IX secretion system PorP/SprF family membrane protein
MRNALAISALILCFSAFPGISYSQQRPQLTHHLFQQIAYNPAFAGAKGYLQSGLSFRSQWMGMEEAPRTAFFNVHSGLRNKRIGLGFHVQSDWAGPARFTQIQAVYAYRIQLEKIRLSAGVQAGMENYRVDWSELELETPMDDAFPQMPASWWSPVIGVGVLVQAPHWYAGLSCPSLLEQDLFYDSAGPFSTRRLRHAYAMAGGDWDLTDDWRILGAALFSAVWGKEPYAAPASWDFYSGFFYRDLLLTGLSFQSGAPYNGPGKGLGQSGGLFTVLQLENGLRIGLSYDIPFSQLSGPSGGSLEWTMGYEWKVRARRISTPRFFW